MITAISPDHPNEPYDVVMEITPELALKWLEGNTHNRPVNQAHVDRLVRDILAGRWRLTHQGIAFDTEGLLIDGQHRLWAIAEASRAVVVRVFYNEPPINRYVLDSGQRRSNLDILTITGQVGEITSKHLATLRAMLAGRSSRTTRMSPGEEAEQYEHHRHAIEFAMRHLGTASTRGVAIAVSRAVIARSYYSADHAQLAHFCEVMRTGVATGDADMPIILLWQFLVRVHEKGRGEGARRIRYARTQWALNSFLDGRIPRRLGQSRYEFFPLPDEVEAAA